MECFGGALGGPNRSFLASIFACDSKSACACARWVCEAVWMRLGSGSERPKSAQERPRAAKSAPRAAKSGPRAVLGRSWGGLGRCWVVLLALLAALGSLLGRSSVHKCCALPVLAGEGFFKLFFTFFSLSKVNMFFDRFWVASGSQVGSILGAKIDRSRAKFGPRWLLKRYFLKNVNFHETSAGVMSGAFPGPQDGTLNRPKTALRRSSKPSFFVFVFDIVFLPSWVRFWLHLGPPLGAKIAPSAAGQRYAERQKRP